MEEFEKIGSQYAQNYYSAFESNRASLAQCYRPNSLMTYNGEKIGGVENIMAKLSALPFQKCQFQVQVCDCHPSPSGGVIVFIDGELKPGVEEHSLRFAEVFHLAPEQGNWFITNQIFRILGGGSH